MTRLVRMTAGGRLTVPATARRELGLEGSSDFEIDTKDDAIVLRPVVVLPREDAWAYTPEHRARLARAHRDSVEGRVRRLTERQLRRRVER
ncbi:MAG: hypothetical protein ACRDF0_06945 [Candidatus Limnocylindria bacterium]